MILKITRLCNFSETWGPFPLAVLKARKLNFCVWALYHYYNFNWVANCRNKKKRCKLTYPNVHGSQGKIRLGFLLTWNTMLPVKYIHNTRTIFWNSGNNSFKNFFKSEKKSQKYDLSSFTLHPLQQAHEKMFFFKKKKKLLCSLYVCLLKNYILL